MTDVKNEAVFLALSPTTSSLSFTSATTQMLHLLHFYSFPLRGMPILPPQKFYLSCCPFALMAYCNTPTEPDEMSALKTSLAPTG